MSVQLPCPFVVAPRVGARITLVASALALAGCSGESAVAPSLASAARSVAAPMIASALSGNDLVGTIGDTIMAMNNTKITLKARSTSSRVRFTTWRVVTEKPIATITGTGATATLNLGSTSGQGMVIASLSGRSDTSFLWNADPINVTSVEIVGVGSTVKVGTSVRPRLEYTIHTVKTRTVFANWASNNANATYDAASGLFTFRTSGTAQIEAASGTKSITLNATVLAPITSGSLALARNRFVAGDSTTVTATFRDAGGQPVVCNTSTWSTSPTSGIVQLKRGVSQVVATLIGLSAGTATVSASCDGSAAFAATLTVDAATVQTPPPTPQAGALNLRVVRLDPTLPGNVLVSSGLPLAKGVLMPNAVSNVRLLAGSAEIARHASALQGRHTDGSVRSVLLQFSVPASSVNQTFQLALSGRTIPEVAKGATRSEPTAIITYADPSDLVATGIVGRTKSLLQTPTTPAHFAQYDSDFAKWEATLWSPAKAAFTLNYYDRGLAYFAFFARTGNPVYFARGAELARRYRVEYVEANGYNINEVSSSLDGLMVHYLFTGDEASRTAILNVASYFEMFRGTSTIMTDVNHSWMDNRAQARVLSSKVLSWMLGATSLPNNGGRTAAYANLRAEMIQDVSDIIKSQYPDGAWRWKSQCYGSKNFMSGLLDGVLGLYYEEVSADPAVLNAVAKSFTFMQTTQWMPAGKAFKYLELTCSGQGGPTAAGDLNGLFLDGLGFLYRRSNDPKWRALGEAVFEGGVSGGYLNDDKQFNQQYQMSYRWLGDR